MPGALSYAPRLMGAAEAAKYLGISEGTLRKLDIPRRRLGARRLYDRVDLEAFASDLPLETESGGSSLDAAFGTAPHPDGQEGR